MPIGSVASSCFGLCLAIARLLEASKHNKEEYKALHKVTTNIGEFLEELQCSKISPRVEGVLRKHRERGAVELALLPLPL